MARLAPRRTTRDICLRGARWLSVRAGSHVRPHPQKLKAGQLGEDALFLYQGTGIVTAGVADGTSAAEGGAYARRLMAEAEAVAKRAPPDHEIALQPAAVLLGAWEAARQASPAIEGRATSCVVSVDEEAGMCRAVALGDSGMMLMRPQASGGWAVRYTWHQEREIEGQEQQHYFNCPYQLGVLSGAEVNTPADALEVEMSVSAGDVVIVATDGLFDVLWCDDIVDVLSDSLADGEEAAAAALTKSAQLQAINSRRETPFGARAKDEGLISRPGEVMDDVAVAVISVV